MSTTGTILGCDTRGMQKLITTQPLAAKLGYFFGTVAQAYKEEPSDFCAIRLLNQTNVQATAVYVSSTKDERTLEGAGFRKGDKILVQLSQYLKERWMSVQFEDQDYEVLCVDYNSKKCTSIQRKKLLWKVLLFQRKRFNSLFVVRKILAYF